MVKGKRGTDNNAVFVIDLKNKNKLCPVSSIILFWLLSSKFGSTKLFIIARAPLRAKIVNINGMVNAKRGTDNNAAFVIDLKNKNIPCPPTSIILLSFSSGKFGITNFFKGIKVKPRAKVVNNNEGVKDKRNGANKAAIVTDLKSKNKFCPTNSIFLL